MKIFGHIEQCNRYLDLALQKQQVITSNIANVDTPGYRAKQLDFEAVLESESSGDPGCLRTTDPRHIQHPPELLREASVRESSTGALRRDLNNVDMDKEMTELAQNVLKFSAVAQIVQAKLRGIESAIRG